MSKTKTAEEKAAAKAAKEAEKALGGEAPKKNASVVDVVGPDGVIRSYSIKVHGEDFKELAEEFAGKVEGRKVVAHE